MFVVQRRPRDREAAAGVLIVPPFADEMNRSRRMFTLLAESLAGRGFLVMLPDFLGTGDSEGEFVEASWEAWRAQLVACIGHLREATGRDDYSVVALRSGALLAAGVLDEGDVPRPRSLVLWQPVIDGDDFLGRFLRMRLAAEMLASGERVTTQVLREQLARGESVDVAGYELPPALAEGMASARLAEMRPSVADRTLWLDVVSRPGTPRQAARSQLAAAWAEDGLALECEVVSGSPFWNSQEIVENRALVGRTADFLEQAHGLGG
ncbi:MAG TPA: hydrolase 2, exosortase A system-associated [Gammaproteobacteria bacterium]|nr:hydrolase 2, exosortase A system-associated [Gammaproteobacteria bacterium]